MTGYCPRSKYVPSNAFDICVQESKIKPHPVYALSDEAAIIVDGERVYMIGKNGYKIVNGEVVEKI
jgi:hypothetical protein